jgi:hypothetical protein
MILRYYKFNFEQLFKKNGKTGDFHTNKQNLVKENSWQIVASRNDDNNIDNERIE